MEKEFIVSIYFNLYKTFLTVVERTEDKFILHYLNSTTANIDLKDISSSQSLESITEIFSMLSEYFDKIKFLNIVLSPEYVHNTIFPGDINTISNDVYELLNLEIENAFEDKKIDDFKINLTGIFSPTTMTNEMLLVNLLPKTIEDSINQMFIDYGLLVNEIYFNNSALVNTFLFNYPEKSNERSAIICFHKDILEILLVAQSKLIAYEFVIRDDETIDQIVEKKLQEMFFNSKIAAVDNLFICGTELSKDVFIKCWKTGSFLSADTRRLNPFRMFTTELEERDKEYCARVFHLFTSCIGGSLPFYLKNENV